MLIKAVTKSESPVCYHVGVYRGFPRHQYLKAIRLMCLIHIYLLPGQSQLSLITQNCSIKSREERKNSASTFRGYLRMSVLDESGGEKRKTKVNVLK